MNVKKVLKKLAVIAILLIAAIKADAQVIVDADTAVAVMANAEEVHSPRKATIYSALLPGLGQAYNKKYWKIPIIYAGFGVIGYFIDWNNDNYQLYKLAYSHLTDKDSTTNAFLELEAAQYYDLSNPSRFENFKNGLSRQQDYFRRNRDLLIISLLGFYGLNIIDASVDAHLFNFDISEDLSMRWEPAVKQYNHQNIYSINCTFNF